MSILLSIHFVLLRCVRQGDSLERNPDHSVMTLCRMTQSETKKNAWMSCWMFSLKSSAVWGVRKSLVASDPMTAVIKGSLKWPFCRKRTFCHSPCRCVTRRSILLQQFSSGLANGNDGYIGLKWRFLRPYLKKCFSLGKIHVFLNGCTAYHTHTWSQPTKAAV